MTTICECMYLERIEVVCYVFHINQLSFQEICMDMPYDAYSTLDKQNQKKL